MNHDKSLRLIDVLDTEAVDLTFIKKNGEERQMICTRNFPLLSSCPEEFDYVPPKGYGAPDPGDHRVRVWDLQKKAWRVIDLWTVQQWKVVPGLLNISED